MPVLVFKWWSVTKEVLDSGFQAILICDKVRKVLVLMPGAVLTMSDCHDFFGWVCGVFLSLIL